MSINDIETLNTCRECRKSIEKLEEKQNEMTFYKSRSYGNIWSGTVSDPTANTAIKAEQLQQEKANLINKCLEESIKGFDIISEKLPLKLQGVAISYFLSGYTVKETAKKNGISVDTVYSYRKQIKNILTADD